DPSLANGTAPTYGVSQPGGGFGSPPGSAAAAAPSGATSYAANFKLFAVLVSSTPPANLVYNAGAGTEDRISSLDRASTIANIADGSSNTIAFAEKYGVCQATSNNFTPAPSTYQNLPANGGCLWGEPNFNAAMPFFAYPEGGINNGSTYTNGMGLKFQI